VTNSSLRNVPSFLYLQGQKTSGIAGLGRVAFDICFGGALYAIVESLNLDLSPDLYSKIVDYSRKIKKKVCTFDTSQMYYYP